MATEIKIIETETEFRALKSTWQHLITKSQTSSPFLTFEWISEWWATYHNRLKNPELKIIVLADSNQRLAILPLFVHQKKLSPTFEFKALQFMGTEFESSDYLDIIAPETQKPLYLQQIFSSSTFLKLLKSTDVLDLPNITDDASLLKNKNMIEQIIGNSSYLYRTKTCPYIELPQTVDAFLQNLSRNLRSNLRRTQNKFNKNGLTIEVVNNEQELDQAIRQLFELHSMRFAAKQAKTKFVFENRGAFHQRIAKIFFRNHWLQLYQIKDRQKVIGSLYCYKFRESMMYMQGGFDPSYHKFALGNLIILRAITDAIEMKYKIFDFMRGNEAYKARWATHYRYLNELIFPVTLKAKLYYFYRDMIYRTKKTVKTVLKNEGKQS